MRELIALGKIAREAIRQPNESLVLVHLYLWETRRLHEDKHLFLEIPLKRMISRHRLFLHLRQFHLVSSVNWLLTNYLIPIETVAWLY